MKNFEQYIKSEGILHDILDIKPGASEEEIKAAYKKKAAEPEGTDGVTMADLRYARKILLKKQDEYEAAGDEKWFKDQRRRRVNKPLKLSAEPAAKQLVRALKAGRWTPLRSGVHNGDAWAAAYHNSIEELGHPDGEILFRVSSKKPELMVYYDAMKTAGPHPIDNPPGNPVIIDISHDEEGKPGYDFNALTAAIKSVQGRAASEVYNKRRRKQGRYFIPEDE